MSQPRSAWLGDFFLLSALWGASFLFMRNAAMELGPLPTAAARVGIAALCLLPLLWRRGLLPELVRHHRPVLFVGLLNSGIPFALYSYAVLSISTGLSAILNATVPLFGAVVAWAWLRERPGASRSLGLALGFVGVALLAWNKASFTPKAGAAATGWAVLACLLACVCYALAATFTKRYLGEVKPLVLAAGSQLGATLGLALPALWLWPGQAPSLTALASLLAVGVLCTALAYILFFRLIANVGPARTLTVTFVVPVFGVLYGTLLLGEALTPAMLGCGVVILCGTALATGVVRLPARK
ncbi:MAG: EamA family transporter [Variovorax paradoxus]|jgi:drug/metabolite transporter (DMT)-like permease|nr:MAG: EamA family transporter [Variovorax paradoxus]PZQ17606.1 MAG: EamA family transporter [Variovorax paradoxus]